MKEQTSCNGISVGWINSEGREWLSPAPFSSLEFARTYADGLNNTEQEHGSRDVWFVMVGDAECSSPCHLDQYSGGLHHWLFDADEDEFPEGRMVCQHCETWRDFTDSDFDDFDEP